MESTTARYDFSFPPKASSNNSSTHSASNRVNYNHQFNGNSSNFSGPIPKSESTSLLSCASQVPLHNVAGSGASIINVRSLRNQHGSSNACFNCVARPEPPPQNRHHQHHHSVGSSSAQYNGRQRSQYTGGQYQQQQSYPFMSNSNSNGMSTGHHQSTHCAPGTPKENGNCSFTFDDLKNTLSFMDDSPLVNNSSAQSSSTTQKQNYLDNSTQLMVNPNIAPMANSENLSLHSGGSSSSSASSAYTSGSGISSSGMTKSVSNPMLLSTCSSASSLSGVSTSPVSMTSVTSGDIVDKRSQLMQRHSMSKFDFNCHTSHHHQHQHHTQSPGSLNLPLPLPNPSSSGSHNNTNNESSTLIQPVASMHMNSTTASIETAAKKYRFAAQNSEATCCWKGKLPPKQYKPPIVYSTKVFVGGLPWDICEADLCKEFGVFGLCRIEWTNKDRYYMTTQSNFQDGIDSQNSYRHSRSMASLKHSNTMSSMSSSSSQSLTSNGSQAGDCPSNNSSGNKQRTSPGFAYVIYESEYSVRALVSNCIEDYQNGRDRVEYFFKISTRRVRNKEVQIIPWILADNNFATCNLKDLDPKKTVFVGNLHGTMTARDLAHIMNELFGGVVYAGIDIDKLKYPIGSGRVTFAHQQNFMRAVRAAFVDIQSLKFSKRIQIDPYLEDVQCFLCMTDKGIYFCRDFQCFNYYCGACWEKQHSINQMGNHKPLMRKREEK